MKKHFWDNLCTDNSIYVYFDRMYTPPETNITQWVNVRTKGLKIGQMSEASLIVYLFTRQDTEGDDIAALRDIVFHYLQETIDLYDENWVKIGAMKVLPDSEPDTIYLPDNGKMKTMIFDLKWGAVF